MPIETEARVTAIIERAYNVKSIRLEPARQAEFKAGQFLQVYFKDAPGLKRYLSLSSSPTETGFIEFTKKLTQSDFSVRIGGLKVGELLVVKYPFGNFTLKPDLRKVAFLSGGIGITPIRSICRYAVDKKLDIDIILLYGNRTFRDIAFREEFEHMQSQFQGLKVVHVLCEKAIECPTRIGLINSDIIKEEIPDFCVRKFFLCGPPVMVTTMKQILNSELKVAGENIITENFEGY